MKGKADSSHPLKMAAFPRPKIMNYLNITHCDQHNGDGNRTVLWVSGCSHHCKGCRSSFSWDPGAGIPFDEKAKEELFKDLTEEWCAGVTFSGGDPMFFDNRDTVIGLAKEIHEKFPNKTQWLYTGYQWHEILNDPTMTNIVKYVDVICDGEYIDSLKNPECHWVGSSNQNVINVKKRLKQVSEISNSIL